MEKIKAVIRKYFPVPARVPYLCAVLCAVIHVVSELSAPFSDFFNRRISTLFRGLNALVTCFVPFSLAEGLIISLPMLFVTVLVICVKKTNRSAEEGIRFVASLGSVVALLYSMFVVTTIVAYNGSPLSDKLGLKQKPVTADELSATAQYMIEQLDETLNDVDFRYGGSSVMPYSLGEMNRKLLDAYDKLADEYDFIPRLYSRVKPICLSEPMTYTHMSGMYTFYTGEANLNINFPDYNLPFTAAHELAHQRGFLPENEANFIAFLVCAASDDPYIRYSGYLNMVEYLDSALSKENYEKFAEVYQSLDIRVKYEMRAYNEFFEKYRENRAADISSKVNDTYLKVQGLEEGEKSYGMVVDLAVAYAASLNKAAD